MEEGTSKLPKGEAALQEALNKLGCPLLLVYPSLACH